MPGKPFLPHHVDQRIFIAQGEPVRLWEFIDRLLATMRLGPVTRSISHGTACRIGDTLEMIYRSLRIKKEPPMTRFVANQMATPHWFELGAAWRDLGYEAEISIEEGLARLASSLGSEPGGE